MRIWRKAKSDTKTAMNDDDGRRLLPAFGVNCGKELVLTVVALCERVGLDVGVEVVPMPPTRNVAVKKLLEEGVEMLGVGVDVLEGEVVVGIGTGDVLVFGGA